MRPPLGRTVDAGVEDVEEEGCTSGGKLAESGMPHSLLLAVSSLEAAVAWWHSAATVVRGNGGKKAPPRGTDDQGNGGTFSDCRCCRSCCCALSFLLEDDEDPRVDVVVVAAVVVRGILVVARLATLPVAVERGASREDSPPGVPHTQTARSKQQGYPTGTGSSRMVVLVVFGGVRSV